MHNNESKEQLAVFDSLINGLADQATDSKVAPETFFSKTEQVIETIVSSKWNSILASGPDDSVLLIHGDAESRKELLELQGQSQSKTGHWVEAIDHPELVVTPIEVSQSLWGWLVVRFNQTKATSVQKDVIEGVAEIVGEFVREQNQKAASSKENFAEEVFRFSVNAHRSLDSVEVGHHLANDARALLRCERVSVFSVNHGSPRLLAVSSVANVERRSELVRQMKSLIARASRKRQSVFSDQPPGDSNLATLLENFIAKTGLPFVFAVPILSGASNANTKRRLTGYLLAESTSEIDRFHFARSISFVIPHAEAALRNAEQHDAIPFRRPLAGLGRLTRFANLSRMGAIVGLVGLAVIASMLLKTDFKVRIGGELRPVVQRNIFSPYDGVVETVFVDHGDQVTVNQPLIQIRSADLDLEIEKAFSDIQKIDQLKDSKRIALNQVSGANADPNVAAQIASEISDLDFQKASLVEKEKFLRAEREKLSIVCPIDGQVITWQVKQNLANKPVRWGDPMLKVAFLNGDWNLVFRVPERRIGYLLDAAKASDQPVELEFFLESNPGKKYRVPIVEIAQSASQDAELGAVTLVKCNVPDELKAKRQGATVAGDVYCGKRSFWFVWTREMSDAIKRRFVW